MAPAFNDLFWPYAGNRDLKSETGVAYEFGLERRFSRSITVDLVIFRRAVDNMIAWAPTGPGGLWRPSNINRYSVNGLETEFEVRLASFQVSVSYSLMD
ncbi:MAG: TonB-dependent receptor, partial [Candidatus Marinimicrobia bacterium]|nr:TonB-dependent receptor [Candidatus Neomarinimicrobiota bacterium]